MRRRVVDGAAFDVGGDDGRGEGEIADGVLAGRPWRAIVGDRGMELDELPLEGFVVAFDADRPAARGRPWRAVGIRERGDGAAQERRRELERGAAVRAVELPGLPVAGDAGQVDPRGDAFDVAKPEDGRDARRPDPGELEAIRVAEQAANPIQLVDHAVEDPVTVDPG